MVPCFCKHRDELSTTSEISITSEMREPVGVATNDDGIDLNFEYIKYE
jgi:hypothetical protein